MVRREGTTDLSAEAPRRRMNADRTGLTTEDTEATKTSMAQKADRQGCKPDSDNPKPGT